MHSHETSATAETSATGTVGGAAGCSASGAVLEAETGACVFVESPYSGPVSHNLRYLNLCGLDAYARGEMPVATHAFMTTHPAAAGYFVSDYDKKWDILSRKQAIARGQVLRRRCDLTVLYLDRGMSKGMGEAMAYCKANGLPFETRYLDVDRVLALKAPLITRDLIEAILSTADLKPLLQCADPTVV